MAKKSPDEQLSIGDLAEATGIAPDTIRVWERRYGKPVPIRLPKGHRRYTRAHVRWLRRVAEALARGHRPGEVVRATARQLDAMLEPDDEAPVGRRVAALVERVRNFDRTGLERGLARPSDSLGPMRFVEEVVAPLVTEVGRRWADGDLDVRHEHFVTETLQDVLRTLRIDLDARPRGAPVLLSTLPGEEHGLGLQMAAVVCTVAGVRTRILGTETPLDEIARAAAEMKARAVALSVSLATGGVDTDRTLADLRGRLPATVRLVIGGRGARGVRRGPRRVEYVDGLAGFAEWLDGL